LSNIITISLRLQYATYFSLVQFSSTNGLENKFISHIFLNILWQIREILEQT